ncbi:MAG: bifunctional diaminohydroxyphosphoribosylaminopyrimidine deaminase/5-amino-6-(5-phosphoribosylamino)uracil reductase RibD [Bacteroidales bacterium]|nr:bifunctional diaminohydroxyphosphoribosylaminopyrimidine deaminase/5-amino-6-(5-phosphoribosylamino)uracil reductase RibD [Bacteroidales bacterium]
MNGLKHNFTSEDVRFMKHSLALAEKGLGFVNPNPLVGAVIVKDGRIIGEGYHECFGEAHAEINAIRNCRESLEGSTIYVTLEPCSHFGKTPPCSLAIIENKFKKVVIAMSDPNPLVAGRGIAMMQEKGIEVFCGLLEQEAKKINEVFIKYITNKKPFVALKTAMSLDGKIAAHTGDSKWISNEISRNFVHELRNRYAGIMVGADTVIADDPSLTCRVVGQETRNPVRIVVDSTLRMPENSQILNVTDARTVIAVTERADKKKVNSFRERGVEILEVKAISGKVDLEDLMIHLGEMNIDGILLEGGGTLNFSALQSGIVDKVYSFIAPKFIGGIHAKTPVEGLGVEKVSNAFELDQIQCEQMDNDILITGYIRQ